jgi:hypothetical protein
MALIGKLINSPKADIKIVRLLRVEIRPQADDFHVSAPVSQNGTAIAEYSIAKRWRSRQHEKQHRTALDDTSGVSIRSQANESGKN